MHEVTVVTDGSCIGNPGPGGWACILRCGEQMRELRDCRKIKFTIQLFQLPRGEIE